MRRTGHSCGGSSRFWRVTSWTTSMLVVVPAARSSARRPPRPAPDAPCIVRTVNSAPQAGLRIVRVPLLFPPARAQKLILPSNPCATRRPSTDDLTCPGRPLGFWLSDSRVPVVPFPARPLGHPHDVALAARVRLVPYCRSSAWSKAVANGLHAPPWLARPCPAKCRRAWRRLRPIASAVDPGGSRWPPGRSPPACPADVRLPLAGGCRRAEPAPMLLPTRTARSCGSPSGRGYLQEPGGVARPGGQGCRHGAARITSGTAKAASLHQGSVVGSAGEPSPVS